MANDSYFLFHDDNNKIKYKYCHNGQAENTQND